MGKGKLIQFYSIISEGDMIMEEKRLLLCILQQKIILCKKQNHKQTRKKYKWKFHWSRSREESNYKRIVGNYKGRDWLDSKFQENTVPTWVRNICNVCETKIWCA